MGLLYDRESLKAAHEIIKSWTYEDIQDLYHEVPRLGLNANFQQKKLRNWGYQFVRIAQEGLKRRNVKDNKGIEETHYLSYLEERLTSSDFVDSQSLEDFIQTHTF